MRKNWLLYFLIKPSFWSQSRFWVLTCVLKWLRQVKWECNSFDSSCIFISDRGVNKFAIIAQGYTINMLLKVFSWLESNFSFLNFVLLVSDDYKGLWKVSIWVKVHYVFWLLIPGSGKMLYDLKILAASLK